MEYLTPKVQRVYSQPNYREHQSHDGMIVSRQFELGGSRKHQTSPASSPAVLQPGEGPGNVRRAANFASAAAAHAVNGMPQASQEDVEARLAICRACPLFRVLPPNKIPKSLADLDEVGTCTHKSCGCYLHSHPTANPSKLRWADQKCPLNKWLPVEAKPHE
jgi:hypothetical protein